MELAAQGQGTADPNPLVGAVLVRDGEIVGEGWHQRAGEPHAEVFALEMAGANARGSTLYINLEPCCHYGRTPPCAPQLLQAGVARVVVGLVDPDPRVSGQGVKMLEEAGVEIVTPPEELLLDCAFLNQFFVASVRTGRPFVTLKYAISLDGKIATRTGHSQWITGEEARARVHQERSAHQAILVGRETVLRDDPHLNVRGFPGARQPLRIVLDSQGRLPDTARVLSSAGGAVLFATTAQSAHNWRESIKAKGAEIVIVEEDDEGRVSLRALLEYLNDQGIRSLFVEGGAQIHGAFLDQRLATRVISFIAPVIIGGAKALSPVGGVGADTMDVAQQLTYAKGGSVGGDFYIEGYLDDSWLGTPQSE